VSQLENIAMTDAAPDHHTDPRSGLIDEGMLSPLLEVWRFIYLENQGEWFALARELNRSAMCLYQVHLDAGNGGPANAQAPTAVRIYARALNAYAASIILAERALAIEAAGAVRAIYEAGFWLSFLAVDPVRALEELQIDEDVQAIQRERLLRERQAGDVPMIAASMTREAERQNRLGKRKALSIRAVAETTPERPGYLEYRLLSNFYGHLSNGSLDSLKQKVGQGAVINILGPHESEIPRALFFAVDAMTRTAGYFAVLMNEDRAVERLKASKLKMLELMAKRSQGVDPRTAD
jgi:hypothetical protein